ncbi:MipA/OmpV family protein [Bacteriovorax sp. DB6_IX]|uniref:MipA/OmpV family protein n=1 Tax=Bacteriovorax sp. DB6_IX TaxID=1353530 RepID=UPI00038A1014|nr:MipA/OmpV family protein [Bacteriovorax sp. DB6_IX]EQC50474.1 MltA-interacting protein MipA [Bacteriovorax sp. DB6_IX]
MKLLFLFLILTLSSSLTMAEAPNSKKSFGKRERPLYELGAGVLHSQFPHYPGASTTKKVTLPFPTALYRGKTFRLKREEGARGIFYSGDRVELDVSFDGTLASDGDDTKVRQGMNELDALIEFGPRFLYNILKVSKTNPWDFDFHFATRMAFSTGFLENMHERGLVFNPFFTLRRISLFTDDDLFASFLSVKYATQKWHQYYYGVPQKYVTPTRPFYQADSGVAEYSLALLYNYPLKKDIYIFAGLIQSLYKDSANRNSPLLTKTTNTSTVFGIYWNFYKSKQTVLD